MHWICAKHPSSPDRGRFRQKGFTCQIVRFSRNISIKKYVSTFNKTSYELNIRSDTKKCVFNSTRRLRNWLANVWKKAPDSNHPVWIRAWCGVCDVNVVWRYSVGPRTASWRQLQSVIRVISWRHFRNPYNVNIILEADTTYTATRRQRVARRTT